MAAPATPNARTTFSEARSTPRRRAAGLLARRGRPLGRGVAGPQARLAASSGAACGHCPSGHGVALGRPRGSALPASRRGASSPENSEQLMVALEHPM